MAGIRQAWLRTMSIWRPFVLVVFAIVIAGCPGMDGNLTSGDGDGDGTGDGVGMGTDGPLSAKIINFTADSQVSLTDPFVSVLYEVENMPADATLATFYVPVIGVPPNLSEDGDRVAIDEAATLVSGQGAFQFKPTEAGSGKYQVGITIVTADGSTSLDALSEGRILVEGLPEPKFVLPIADVDQDFATVNRGDDVLVTFDAGDPENDVQWRVFYLDNLTDCERIVDLPSVAVDELGTQVGSPGSGNVGSVTLATADLNAGCYQLGISATDSGSSIATTVDRGNADLIVTNIAGPIVLVIDAGSAAPPSVSFTAPGASAVCLEVVNGVVTPFTIRFDATVPQPGVTALITIFHDDDRVGSNGFTTILDQISHTNIPTAGVALPTNLPEGITNIGAAIDDGVNPIQYDYAVGAVTIAKTCSP